MRVNDLARFIIAREATRIAKEQGRPKPWTKDPILQTYRFCNVRREDDAVTKWLRESYYPRIDGFMSGDPSPDVWFAAVVARLLNLPESLDDVAVQHRAVVPWKPEKFRRILHARKANGEKNFNAAYIVSTNGVQMDKVDYLVARVLGPLWADRKLLRPKLGDELAGYFAKLTDYDGLGSFIAAQVIADLKYMDPLKHAPDWHTFAASGPGSRRGLNRVMGRDPGDSWREAEWRATLEGLREVLNKRLAKSDLFVVPLHAQDVQNCLCEFDKYERIRLGEGRPKQLYPGRE